MKNYEEWSDFEINSAAHNEVKVLGFSLELLGDDKIKWSKSGYDDVFTDRCSYTPSGLRDYCNSPTEAWPIILQNRIGLTFVNGAWRASSVMAGYHEHSHANPLRAAMIAFLMMQDAKNV